MSDFTDVTGFVKDNFAKMCEPVQGLPFLYTGKAPELGQKLQIQINLPDGCWGRLSGEVTNISERPSQKDAEMSCCECGDLGQNCLGALNGQKIKGRVQLNFDFCDNETLVGRFGIQKMYTVTLRCDHSRECIWILEKIEKVISEKN